MPASYRFAIGDHNASDYDFPLEPSSPQLTYYLSGQPHEFTCTIDGHSQAGENLQELVQDAWVWRNNKLIFRGPVLAPQDTIDDKSHTIAITAHSYRERLAHWPIPLPASGSTSTLYPLGTATPPGLGWLAIQLTAPHSDLADIIVDQHSASGTSRAQSAQSGTPTDQAIDQIAQVNPFDWDLIPNMQGGVEYHTWAPTRGVARPDNILRVPSPGTAGGNCTLTRTFDLSNFANEIWMSGQDANGKTINAIAPGTRTYGPEGLWIATPTSQTNATGATDTASSLQAQANNQYATASVPQAAYTLSVSEGWWPGPDLLWLGDSPQLVIKSGRLNINNPARVQQIVLAPTDGAENVQITVGAKPLGKSAEYALARGLAALARRIRNVETRQ